MHAGRRLADSLAAAGQVLALPIAVNAVNEGAVPTRPLPACSPVSGAVTFAVRQIVVGAVLVLFAFLLFMLLGALHKQTPKAGIS